MKVYRKAGLCQKEVFLKFLFKCLDSDPLNRIESFTILDQRKYIRDPYLGCIVIKTVEEDKNRYVYATDEVHSFIPINSYRYPELDWGCLCVRGSRRDWDNMVVRNPEEIPLTIEHISKALAEGVYNTTSILEPIIVDDVLHHQLTCFSEVD